MKILGTKFYGHDSSICILDTDKKTIFALTTERYTRSKHDSAPITLMEDYLRGQSFDHMSHSFSSFDEKDRCLESSYEGIARAIEAQAEYTGDDSLRDLSKSIRISYVEANDADKSLVNKNALIEGINALMKSIDSHVIDFDFMDHHLCHAMSAYYSSPYYNTPCLVVTLDGQGDGFFWENIFD